MRLIFDSDEVMFDCLGKVLRLYNKEYGLNIKREFITKWELSNFEAPGTSMRKYFSQEGFFRDLSPKGNAVVCLEELHKEGDEIIVCTASPPEGMKDKFICITENFSFIRPENIIMTHRKDLVAGDAILDDYIGNLKNSICKYPTLFTEKNPWATNQDWPLKANSFEAFYNFIQEVKGGRIK